ncbi:hypothetical protein TSUD_164370, partial [Trifolium subterraneum]
MSIEATRRFTVLSSHLNPTRSTSDPHSFSLSASVLSSQTQQDCVFCNIIRGQSPALKALPHYPEISFPFIGCYSSINSFNVLINNGAAAGQVIFHTHMHIIPRKAFDCLWTSESLLRHPLNLDDEKVSQLAASIQEQLMVSDICQE